MLDQAPAHRLSRLALWVCWPAIGLNSPLMFCLPMGYALLREERRARGAVPLSRADRVTRLRVWLCILLCTSGMQVRPALALALALVILVLDALDGALARSDATQSERGAWFDMEADGLLVASLCFSAWSFGGLPSWILLPGMARYVYVAALRRWPARGAIPRASWARWSFLFGTLGLIALPLLSQASRTWLGAAVVLNCVFSFGRSFFWSYRRSYTSAR